MSVLERMGASWVHVKYYWVYAGGSDGSLTVLVWQQRGLQILPEHLITSISFILPSRVGERFVCSVSWTKWDVLASLKGERGRTADVSENSEWSHRDGSVFLTLCDIHPNLRSQAKTVNPDERRPSWLEAASLTQVICATIVYAGLVYSQILLVPSH